MERRGGRVRNISSIDGPQPAMFLMFLFMYVHFFKIDVLVKGGGRNGWMISGLGFSWVCVMRWMGMGDACG